MKIGSLFSTASSAATVVLFLMPTNARQLGRRSLKGGMTENRHNQHRALIDETKCLGTVSSSDLNVGARCALFKSYFNADTDCLYQYQDFHEYVCPCEELACQPDFTIAQFCTDLLESNCPTELDDCREHLDQCCPFPSRCPSQGQELKLFAKYEWQYEAEDTSGSPLNHDGKLDTKAVVRNGKLFVRDYGGVELDEMPELEGALKMSVRFENVTFYSPESFYAVLAGGGHYAWWVGVDTAFDRTALKFNIGGERGWSADMPSEKEHSVRVKVADEVITHFDSIEYSFDGTADSGERIAIRFNDGNWTKKGWSNPNHFRSLPPASSIRINDSYRTDWDPFEAEIGAISFFSSKTAPTPQPARRD